MMSSFFRPNDLYKEISMDVVRPSFHSLMYPTDEETNFDTRLTLMYSIESNPSESAYPVIIQLTSDSASSAWSQAPASRCRCGFIHTRVIPQGHGWARGERHGNATGGFGNGFVPFWDLMEGLLQRMRSLDCECCSLLFIDFGLLIYGMYDLWRLPFVFHLVWYLDLFSVMMGRV